MSASQVDTSTISKHIDPHCELWAAVLLRAFEDAAGNIESVKTNTKRVMIARSRSWIGTRDFCEVCHLAGLDPEAVKDAWESGRFQFQDKRLRA